MRILFINPWAGEIFPPPSLGYLQAIARINGIVTSAMDLNEKNLAWAQGEKWDLIAVSFHSFSVQYAQKLRSYFKDVKMICGGHHPTAMPEQMLSMGYDQVVIGEGERALMEICQGNCEPVVRCDTYKDLDELPFPDYSGFYGNWSMGIPVISSRGCPFTCSFCASADFWGRKYRMRSAENVVKEILLSGWKQFMFEDDNFTLNRKRAIDVCSLLREKGGFSWQCASRAETLADDELCWNLKSAGCHTVWLGVESFSQMSLDRCGKRTTVGKMVAGIKTAHRYQLDTMSQFIAGLPDDTEKDIDETCRVIRTENIGRRGANVLWLLPNTEAYRRAKEKGFDDNTYLYAGAPFYTLEYDYTTLRNWETKINKA